MIRRAYGVKRVMACARALGTKARAVYTIENFMVDGGPGIRGEWHEESGNAGWRRGQEAKGVG